MATRGPWSVKGIDSQAREAALQAARNEGVTLGDYLNRLLLEADRADAKSRRKSEDLEPGPANDAEDDEALDHRGSPNAALSDLAHRLEAAEARSTLAITGVDQSLSGLLSRLDSAEKSQMAMESRIELTSDELVQTQELLKKRINRLEADDSSEQSLRALKSLEGVLERLSGRVQDNEEAAQRGLKQVDSRLNTLDERVEGVSSSVDAKVGELRETVDSSLEQAAAKIEKVVSEAELRTEGTARHLGERLSNVEQNLAEKSRSFGDRMDKVENEVGSTLSRVTDNVDRFGKAIEENEERSIKAFDLVSKLEEQARQYRDDVSSRLEGVDQSIDAISDRLSQAESLTDTALAGLESSFSQLDERMTSFEEEFADENLSGIRKEMEERLSRIKAELSETVQSTREELARQIEEAAAAPTEAFAEMSTAVSEMNKRLRRTEQRQTQSVEAIGEEVSRLTESLDKRVRQVEQRNESELSSGIRDQIADFTRAFQKRLSELENREPDGSFDAISAQMTALTDALNKRVAASEERSASAIRDFSEHVTTLTKNLQARQDENINQLASQIKASETRQSDSMQRAMSEVKDRIDEVEAATNSTVSPIQKAMSSLAKRLQAVEEFSNPNGAPLEVSDELSFDSFEARLDEADRKTRAKSEDTEGKVAAAAALPTAIDAPSPDEDWKEDEFDMGGGFDGADVEEDPGFAADLPSPDFDLDEANAVEPAEFDEAPFDDLPGDAPAGDYLSRARAAARAAQEPRKSRGGTKKVKAKSKGGGSKLPLIAAAGALAVTAVGTAAFLTMQNGSQAETDYRGDDLQADAEFGEGAIVMPELSEMSEAAGDEALEDNGVIPGEGAEAESVEDAVDDEADAADNETSSPAATAPAEAAEQPAERPASRPAEQAAESAAAPSPSPSTAERAERSEQAARSLNENQIQSVNLAAPPVQQVPSQPEPLPSTPVNTYQEGVQLLESGQISQGVELIRQSANEGLVMGQYRLAKLYESGQGVPRDLAQSREWTTRAAEAGNVKAMHDLAVFYANGEGGPLNYAGAVQWFRRAADHGLVDSQYNLGVLYEEGMGVSANPGEALYWYGVAQKMGDNSAGAKVAELSSELPAEEANAILAEIAAYQPEPMDALANGRFPQQQATPRPQQPSAQSAQSAAPSAEQAMVIQAQNLLNQMGYNAGGADGQFGSQTRNAIIAFQRANGFPQSGTVTPTLVRQLRAVRDTL